MGHLSLSLSDRWQPRAAAPDRRVVLPELPDAPDLGLRGDDLPDHREPGAGPPHRTAPVPLAPGRSWACPALRAQPLSVHPGGGSGASRLRPAGAGADFAPLAT